MQNNSFVYLEKPVAFVLCMCNTVFHAFLGTKCFVFLRWMRLLLYFRPIRPKKLLRSPPPLLVFPVSKVCVVGHDTLFIHLMMMIHLIHND